MAQPKQKPAAKELDDALENTFPASDPVALDDAGNDRARIDRQPAALDRDLVERLAREVRRKSRAPTRH